jgi:hypothetical protein
MGYLIENKPDQIVTATLLLTKSDLLAASSTDIPEFPAVAGYFWQVLYMNAEILTGAGGTPYVGTSQIHIQADLATTPQLRFVNNYMSQAVGTWDQSQYNLLGTNTKYAVNSQLQIHNPNPLTIGDTSLNIYIGAVLIKY